MGDLYKYVIEDNYKRLFKQKIISVNDTIYYFDNFNCKEDTSIFGYNIKIKNQHIQLREPKVNELNRNSTGNLLLAPEIVNQYIVISFIDYDVEYDVENGTMFNNSGTISYYFSFNKEKKKYVFIKRKEFRF